MRDTRAQKLCLTHDGCRYFGQTKYASFQRQLNLYGFQRFAHGLDKGAYFHPCFVRNQRNLVRQMVRRKIKGTKVRRALREEEEPDFYAMDPVDLSPNQIQEVGPTKIEPCSPPIQPVQRTMRERTMVPPIHMDVPSVSVEDLLEGEEDLFAFLADNDWCAL